MPLIPVATYTWANDTRLETAPDGRHMLVPGDSVLLADVRKSIIRTESVVLMQAVSDGVPEGRYAELSFISGDKAIVTMDVVEIILAGVPATHLPPLWWPDPNDPFNEVEDVRPDA